MAPNAAPRVEDTASAAPRGEVPINLVNGAVRVGSSHALAGVPAVWSVFTPRAEARHVDEIAAIPRLFSHALVLRCWGAR